MGGLGRRMRTACGIVGPLAFTAAWVVSGPRQTGYSVRDEHISGLAARDARSPWIMLGGFAALGTSMLLFGGELHRRLGGRDGAGFGPALLAGAGASTLLAGLCRRDRRANRPAGEGARHTQSFENDAHDVASLLGQVCGFMAIAALARRFRGDPEWEALGGPALAVGVVSLALGAWFASETARPGNGIVQRAGITVEVAGLAALSVQAMACDRWQRAQRRRVLDSRP